MLVSCILPTKNRRRFLPMALACFDNRTHREAELIVVDDSDRSNAALFRGRRDVRYIRLTRPEKTGTKINLGIAAARGEVIQLVDDDDYYGPEFLATNVAHLPRRGRARTIVTRCCFLVLCPPGPTLRLSGCGWKPGAFCFHRSLWERQPFRGFRRSYDSQLLRDLDPRIVRVCGAERDYIVVRHGANTWNLIGAGSGPRMTPEEYFGQKDAYPEDVFAVAGDRAGRFYRRLYAA